MVKNRFGFGSGIYAGGNEKFEYPGLIAGEGKSGF